MKKQSRPPFLESGTNQKGKSEISSPFSQETTMSQNHLESDIAKVQEVLVNPTLQTKRLTCRLSAHSRTGLKRLSR